MREETAKHVANLSAGEKQKTNNTTKNTRKHKTKHTTKTKQKSQNPQKRKGGDMVRLMQVKHLPAPHAREKPARNGRLQQGNQSLSRVEVASGKGTASAVSRKSSTNSSGRPRIVEFNMRILPSIVETGCKEATSCVFNWAHCTGSTAWLLQTEGAFFLLSRNSLTPEGSRLRQAKWHRNSALLRAWNASCVARN